MREDTRQWSSYSTATALLLVGSLVALAAVPLFAEARELSRPGPIIQQDRLIERVSLSKRVACPDETVTVTVKTRGTKAEAAGLYVSVNGKTGNPLTVSYGTEGDYDLSVEVFDKQGRTDHRTRKIRVVDCGEIYESVEVKVEHLAADRVAFTAQPRFAAPRPRSRAEGEARLEELKRYVPPIVSSYHWDFGDGETADTTEPYAEHDYSDRDQRSSVNASYVVNVTVATENGHRINGGASVTLTNVYAQNRIERGVIVPSVSIRQVSAEEGGPPQPRLTVRNLEDRPFDVQRIVLHKIPCDPNADASDTEVSPETFLGQSRFEPGETSVDLALSDEIVPATACRVVADGEGETTAGQPVRFSVGMVTRVDEQAAPPLEAVVGAKSATAAMHTELEEAARLLGRDPRGPGVRITDEELHLLRARGQLHRRLASQEDTVQPGSAEPTQ